MKRVLAFLLSILLLGLTACRTETEPTPQSAVPAQQEVAAATGTHIPTQQPETAADTPTPAAQATSSEDTGNNILIAYFSVPEDVDTSGADAVAGASIVVRDSEILGNTEYVANVIRETVGGDLFRIETEADYPLEHEALVDQAADEQNENAHPALKTRIEDPGQYDTIILGYPNWWGDLPQPLYTFLETYDFSGKTIIPFVTHGGSGFSGTRASIAGLQPEAVVSDNTLSLSRNDVAEAEEEIRQWAESLLAG